MRESPFDWASTDQNESVELDRSSVGFDQSALRDPAAETALGV